MGETTSKDYRDPVIFFVHGNPLPKQSFKMGASGGYQPAPLKIWERTVGWAGKRAWAGEPLDRGGFEVHLSFVRSDRRRVDLDNLSKAVLDGLNGVIWTDDKLVYRLVLTKAYADREPLAGVEVRVYWTEEVNA